MDITKCSGSTGAIICPVKEYCYRYTSTASKYQSYFLNIPYKDGNCDMYWGEGAEYIFNKLKEKLEDKK